MGKVYKYSNDIDTDIIIPARYLNVSDPKELAQYTMNPIDEDFAKTVEPGDFIVAGTNFGSGSSREHAPQAIKASGIKAVIAKSYARIFYRNAFNIGLAIFESEEAADKIQNGDQIDVDFDTGLITNHTRQETYQADPIPEFMQTIINDGGLVEHIKKRQE